MMASRLRRLVAGASALLALLVISGCVYRQVPVADPGALAFGDTYFIAGTGGGLPIYSIKKADLTHPDKAQATRVGQVFAPGQLNGTWVNTSCGSPCGLWAPELKPHGDHLVAYFSARCNGSAQCNGSTERCIGMATGNIGGGFNLVQRPFCNPQNSYGLIDPTEFSYGGSNYLLFKRDVPHGTGTKSIAITRLDGNGLNPTLPTTTLLTPTQNWETTSWASVEAPTLVARGSYYWLFYSGNLYKSDHYGVGISRCPTGAGSPLNCGTSSGNGFQANKYGGNPILSADSAGAGYCGAGHQDVTDGGGVLWYHTYLQQVANSESCFSGDNGPPRYLGAKLLGWDSGWPLPNGGRNP